MYKEICLLNFQSIQKYNPRYATKAAFWGSLHYSISLIYLFNIQFKINLPGSNPVQ